MKTILAICAVALILGGCRAGTIAAVGTGIMRGLSNEPTPQTVKVEVQPISCRATTMSIYTRIDCD
jgi:hypothetical protein